MSRRDDENVTDNVTDIVTDNVTETVTGDPEAPTLDLGGRGSADDPEGETTTLAEGRTDTLDETLEETDAGPTEAASGLRAEPRADSPVDPEAETLAAQPAGNALPRGVPERIGPYRILSTLGEGGMGTVYLAEQHEPVEREVAIKLIRSSLGGPAAIARFSAERQAMARLAHPAVAQMYEAGTTDDGFPFFVMERVDGAPLSRFCDTRALGLRERIELFVEICRGVEHAHQKGIVHRDLKPSNVLVAEVEGRAVPKIIDFGIAKAIDQPLTDATLFTQGGIGTPAYMSPEAVDGLDVDTRSDVYALGVMLYELLTGRKPFELKGLPMTRVLRIIAHREPARPSRRLAALEAETQERLARRRGLEPRQLERRLADDLDWIVGRAMAKDREQRYASASELAADLERHLRAEPVLARAPSRSYLVGKFVRRHRTAVTLGALALVALLLGALGTTLGMLEARSEAERANQALRDTEEVTDFLVELFEVSDPSEAGGESITARQLLDRGAARIEAELAAQPLRQARLMQTIATIYSKLQVPREAKRLAEEAVAVREVTLGPEHPDLADSYHRLAVVDRELADYEAAEEAARKALAIREAVYGPEHGAVGEVLRELAVILYRAGRYDEAETTVRRALAIAEQTAGEDDPTAADALETLGNLLKDQGRCAEAIPFLERVLAIREKRLAPLDPLLAYSLNNLGSCHGEVGDYASARDFLERALAIQVQSLGEASTTVAIGRANLGIVYRELGDFEASRQAFLDAHRGLAESLGEEHPMTVNPLAELGVLLGRQGRWDEAEEHLRRALGVWLERPGPEHPLTAWAHWALANVLRDRGTLEEAEDHYRRALAIRRAVLPAGHAEILEAERDYATMLRANGRKEEAAALDGTEPK